MAVFPMRPDLSDEESIKEYIKYMVDRTEYAVEQIQKAIREIKEAQNNG